MNFATRRWLPPALLLALIAAVWALPYHPNCAALAWNNDPAIARVANECILLSAYDEKLLLVQAGIEYAEQEILPDDTFPDSWRERHQRVMSYGPETVALADAVWDSALYQRAVADGHSPSGQEVAARTDLDRRRSEASRDFPELARLAKKSDLAGFTKLLHSSEHPDLVTMREDTEVSGFMKSLGKWEEPDFRQYEEALVQWEAYLESVGRERYWNKIHTARIRRDLAVGKLEEAVLDASVGGLYSEVPRLGWLAYRQGVIDDTEIELTNAAPAGADPDGALAYLAEFQAKERLTLEEEYRKLIERHERRRRLTPPPPRPNSN